MQIQWKEKGSGLVGLRAASQASALIRWLRRSLVIGSESRIARCRMATRRRI